MEAEHSSVKRTGFKVAEFQGFKVLNDEMQINDECAQRRNVHPRRNGNQPRKADPG